LAQAIWVQNIPLKAIATATLLPDSVLLRMPRFLAQLLSGHHLFGPEELPTPGTCEQLRELLASVLPSPSARLEIFQGERRLGRDDCMEASDDDPVVLSVLVQNGRHMPEGCTCDSSQVIDGGVLVQLASDEYVFATQSLLPQERNGAPFIDPRTTMLRAAQEYWAVQTTRKTYNEVDDEDFALGGQGVEDNEIHKEFWFLVDSEGKNVGWIMVGRSSPPHFCFQSSVPEAVFKLTRQCARQHAEELFLQDPKWGSVLEEKSPEAMDDMNMKDCQALLRKHDVHKNYRDRQELLKDARAAFAYHFSQG